MHEYMKRLKKSNLMGIIDTGTVNHAEVEHDLECGVFADSWCDCDPTITIQTQQGDMYVLSDGRVSNSK